MSPRGEGLITDSRAQTLLELMAASWQERNYAACRDLARSLEEVFKGLLAKQELLLAKQEGGVAMEIKQITGEEAIARAEARLEQSAESAKRQIDDQANTAIRHLRDAAAGIEALETGIGTLVDRATGIFVATFELNGQREPVPISGAELNFPRCGYRVSLDADGYHGGQQDPRPVLEVNRRYRAVVLLEPVE